MRKIALSFGLIFVTVVFFTFDCKAGPERDPDVPVLEGALLSPVGAFADATNYVVKINDSMLCGASRGRLKIFSKR